MENNGGTKSRAVKKRKGREKREQKEKRNFLILFGIFTFYFLIAWLLIPSGDDWAWGKEIGQARLANHFEAYNGRYFGNIIEIIITRSLFARLFIYSIINTGIVFLMRKISNHKITYIFCFLLILLIPVSFYSQTYGWLAGFANYNTSTFFFLWLIFLVKKNKVTFLSLTAIFILSMLTQLFIENISISSILIAIIGLAIAVFFKESILPYLSWLLGAISGAIIMFSNSAYHIEGNMRGFSNADVHTFSVRLLTDWTELYVKQNALLLVLFSIVMYLLIENKNLGIFIFFFFPSGYFALRYLMNITWRQQSMFALVIELLLILIFLATLAITIGKSSIPLSGKRHFFSYITISLLLVAPFLIVTPYGPRNILTSFVFLGLALFELISYIKINLESQLVKKISLLFIFCISIFFIGMHGLNKYEENQRIAQLKQDVALGQKEVELNRLPYEFIGHDLTPPDGSVQSDRQKKYHNISIDTKFKITGYHDSALDNLLEKQQ